MQKSFFSRLNYSRLPVSKETFYQSESNPIWLAIQRRETEIFPPSSQFKYQFENVSPLSYQFIVSNCFKWNGRSCICCNDKYVSGSKGIFYQKIDTLKNPFNIKNISHLNCLVMFFCTKKNIMCNLISNSTKDNVEFCCCLLEIEQENPTFWIFKFKEIIIKNKLDKLATVRKLFITLFCFCYSWKMSQNVLEIFSKSN